MGTVEEIIEKAPAIPPMDYKEWYWNTNKKLKAIWEKLKEILNKLDNEADPALFDLVSSTITQLQDIRLLTTSDIVTVVQQSITRTLQEKGTIKPFNLAPTAAGQQDIVTPSAGKALKVLMWFYYCDSDILTELGFLTSNIYVAGLPTRGCCGLNTIGNKPIQGATDEALTMKYSGAGTIRGWVCIEEV